MVNAAKTPSNSFQSTGGKWIRPAVGLLFFLAISISCFYLNMTNKPAGSGFSFDGWMYLCLVTAVLAVFELIAIFKNKTATVSIEGNKLVGDAQSPFLARIFGIGFASKKAEIPLKKIKKATADQAAGWFEIKTEDGLSCCFAAKDPEAAVRSIERLIHKKIK